MFRVRTTVIELVMLAATVVVHCTLIKHRENLICSLVFTALHGMQTRSSDEKAASLSVKRVDCDKTEELSQLIVQILDTVFELPFRGLVTTYEVHLGFSGKRLIDFLLVN